MAELDKVTLEDFSGHVGESFRMVAEAPEPVTLEVRLAEAVSVGNPPRPGVRAPFSIVFEGPAQQILPQGIYRLEHEQLSLELFMVPLTPENGNARYQAIFS